MPSAQNVPAFDWSEGALKVRAFLYEFWCANGRGPTLREVHEAVGYDRGQIIKAYKELAFGEIVFDLSSQNCYILKVPPFSAMPTQVQVFIDDKFHSFAGCAMESVALSRMPPFEDKLVRLESFCACCLEPITIVMRNGEPQSVSSDDIRVHVSKPPHQWAIPTVLPMCDSMNYVLGAKHAERYEKMMGTRGVLFSIDQARPFVKGVADNRMWDYHWTPGPLEPDSIAARIGDMGVDTTNWTPDDL
ncbi:MAG: organomercurial lyase [Acidimicrobiia bacterium]